MKNLIILLILITSCEKIEQRDVYIDQRDGKEYGLVEIGKQTWMDRNMEYTPYHNENYIQSDDYGVFYTWLVAGDICPDGWHLPTADEWEELFKTATQDELRYGEFKALYGGWYQLEYSSEGRLAAWWSADEYGSSYAWVYYIKFRDDIMKTNLPKTSNICIRCLKDEN